MSGLIDDLLRVERIRSSPLELHEQVDPNKLIKVVLVNMRLAAENKKQKLESRLNFEQNTRIMADPVLIRQAMENLIGNAIKYTPEGGNIKIESYVKNGFFFFAVEDNGFGIPADDIPRVFDSFYRAKGKNTKSITGTGLGLSLVKTVVERHGGEIWVDSQEGKGSRFTFRIPITNTNNNHL
jgi:signal transduction histidine kinase